MTTQPCPFCGGINILQEGYHLFCYACGANGPDADNDDDEERSAAWNRRAALASQAQPADTLCKRLQQQCSDWGTYWRAPDAHGVVLSIEQASELLREALGVEVEIPAPGPADNASLVSNEKEESVAALPEGWVAVPIEPTREMLDAPPNAWPADAKIIWRAMLAALPPPPADQGEQQ